MLSRCHKKTRPESTKSTTKANGACQAFRWGQVPQVAEPVLAILEPGWKVAVLPKEIGAQAAADVLSCSIRAVQEMCNCGLLAEGKDWRKISTRGARGEYRIAQHAVLKLLNEGGQLSHPQQPR